MSIKAACRKIVILPDGQRVARKIRSIKYDGTFNKPENIRAKAYVYGKLLNVVPVKYGTLQDELPYTIAEWKVIE